MATVTLMFAALAGLVHIYIFVLESVVFRRPFAYRTFGITNPTEVELLAFPMLNQGFYNLFIGLGTLVGVVGSARDWDPQGSTLVVFGCLFMVGAAAVLVIARPAMARGAVVQGLFPLLALISALVWR